MQEHVLFILYHYGYVNTKCFVSPKTWKNIFCQSAQANKTMRKILNGASFPGQSVPGVLYTSIINTFRKIMQIEM